MREYKAKVMEEKIRVSLYNELDELMGEVIIDPTDFNLLRRMEKAENKIDEYVKQAKNASNEENKTIVSELEELDIKIRESINYIFDTDVCSMIFKNRHALSIAKGKFLFERLLDAFAPVFKDMAVEETKASQTRMAKYTGKYKK